MNFAIGILFEKMEALERIYENFVTNGSVDKNSKSAIDSKNNTKELKIAIHILENQQAVKEG